MLPATAMVVQGGSVMGTRKVISFESVLLKKLSQMGFNNEIILPHSLQALQCHIGEVHLGRRRRTRLLRCQLGGRWMVVPRVVLNDSRRWWLVAIHGFTLNPIAQVTSFAPSPRAPPQRPWPPSHLPFPPRFHPLI
ncbi:zinc finger protein [Sesbania bispinosa]|nr:zinc finger protein [Sesbania bispinosa]